MNIKKFYKPDKAFLERTRHAYLLHYRSRFPHTVRVISGFGYFIRGAAVGASFVFVLSGVAAYADGQNVGPTSVLYPLKRTYESVDLLLANEARKPELHVQFAERRLSEIQEIKQEKPESPKIQNLTADFEKEIQRTLSVFEPPVSLNTERANETVIEEPKRPIEIKKASPPAQEIGRPAREKKSLPQSRALRESDTDITTSNKPTSLPAVQASSVLPREDSEEQVFRVSEKQLRAPAAQIKKVAPVCDSIRVFLKRRGDEVKKILDDNNELFEKYEKNCEHDADDSDRGLEQKPTGGNQGHGSSPKRIEQED